MEMGERKRGPKSIFPEPGVLFSPQTRDLLSTTFAAGAFALCALPPSHAAAPLRRSSEFWMRDDTQIERERRRGGQTRRCRDASSPGLPSSPR